MTTPTYTATVPFRSLGATWLLFLFFGGFLAHQFYLNNIGKALLRLFTLQYLSVAVWIDLFTLNAQVRAYNAELSARTGVASPTA